jgi:crossover junction endodeoxyribonuclease RusA
MISVSLPWPSADLSPNARVHWVTHARAKKAAKNHAWGWTKAAMGPLGIASGSFVGPIAVKIVFHPEIDRARDVDNMQARMKAALDGISLALGVDDKHFRPVSEIGEKRKPGCVVVTLEPAGVKLPLRGAIA